MFEFLYWDITGSVPFDLAMSLISWGAINGAIFKAIKSAILGRLW